MRNRNVGGRLWRQLDCRADVIAEFEIVFRVFSDPCGAAALGKIRACERGFSCEFKQALVISGWKHDAGILAVACVCGMASGLFGIGGGVLLVPLLVLLFAFGQHRAQGTSLVALIPPTGVLALLAYAKGGYVSWQTGLLLLPGLFVGGILGGMLAKRIEPRMMRKVFAATMFALGVWQIAGVWWR
jgi:hypothetical protein